MTWGGDNLQLQYKVITMVTIERDELWASRSNHTLRKAFYFE